MSRTTDLWQDKTLYKFVVQRLLRAATHEDPKQYEGDDANWDKSSGAWGSPSPRIDAAQGLMQLVRFPQGNEASILSEIDRLAHDPVNPVRHQIASGLLGLWEPANNLFWKLAEYFSRNEQRIAILHFFLDRVLLGLPQKDVTRTEALVRLIYDRIVGNPLSGPVRESCTVFFLRRALWDQDPNSAKFFEEAIADPFAKATELLHAIGSCRSLLTYDHEKLSAHENARVRRWAFDFLQRCFKSVDRNLQPLLDQVDGGDTAEDTKSQVEMLARIEDRIAVQVYFASEAFESKKQARSQAADDRALDDERHARLERFATEADELLETLCCARFSKIAYDVLQTLQQLRHANPRRMFLLVGQLVKSSAGDKFTFESLAADRVVEIVEQYLAEERSMFRDDDEVLETLMDLLDMFVEAGWPKAMLLTYRLDEAVRG